MTDKEYTFLNLAYAYCLTANIKLFHTIDPGNRPSDELEFSYFVKDPEKFSHLMSLWDKRSENDTIKIIAQKIGLPEEKRITLSSVSFITSSNIVLPLFSKTGLFSIKRGLYCRRHKVTCLGLPFTDASYDGNPVTGPFQFSFHDIGHAKASNILDSIMDIIPVDEEDMYYFSRNTRFITSQKEEQDFSPIFNELYDALEKQPETGMKRQAEGVLHMIDHEWYSLKRNTLQKVQSQIGSFSKNFLQEVLGEATKDSFIDEQNIKDIMGPVLLTQKVSSQEFSDLSLKEKAKKATMEGINFLISLLER